MTYLRFLPAALVGIGLAAGCGSAPPPTPALANTAHPPPGLPDRLTAHELDRLVADHVIDPIELAVLDRREEWDPTALGERLAGSVLAISYAAPGGWSEATYVDRDRRIWVVGRASRFTVPEGVSISATRIFVTRVQIPSGYTYGGVISVEGSLPPADRRPARWSPPADQLGKT